MDASDQSWGKGKGQGYLMTAVQHDWRFFSFVEFGLLLDCNRGICKWQTTVRDSCRVRVMVAAAAAAGHRARMTMQFFVRSFFSCA